MLMDSVTRPKVTRPKPKGFAPFLKEQNKVLHYYYDDTSIRTEVSKQDLL